MELQGRMSMLFDTVASDYDRIGFFHAFAEQMIGWVGPRAGDRVLDLATGRGAHIGPALERVGATGRVVAVDFVPKMASLTAEATRSLGNVSVLLMNAERLGLADGTFDAAVCGFTIHLVSRPESVSAEALRVLKPGGTFAFSIPGGPVSELWAFYRDLIGDVAPYVDGEKWSLPEFGEPEELLRRSGFVDVEGATFEVHEPVTSPQAFWDMEMSHGMRGFIEALPHEQRRTFKERLLAHLEGMMADGGIVVDRGARFFRGRKRA